MKINMFSAKSSTFDCQKHAKSPVMFICSLPNCNFGNFVCDNCIKTEPHHTSIHKNFVYNINDFLSHQNTKVSTKLLPSLNQTLVDIEKKLSIYSQHIETETQEIDRDFAALFKIFFNASETTKTFLKENVKNELKRLNEKLVNLKKNSKEVIEQESPKKNESFLGSFLSKDPDKIEASNTEELISKLILKNQNFNKLRAEILNLSGETETAGSNPVKYKKNDQSKKLYDEIKDNFDKSCKDMYRQFKLLFEGMEPSDMRKSIFTMKKSLQPQTISIDLDNVSTKSFSSPGQKPKHLIPEGSDVIKKKVAIQSFPEDLNPNIAKVHKTFGTIDYKQEDSFFNSLPEQGPFQYEDGSVYQGNLKDDLRHGRGRFLFSDGAYYEGYWKDDIPYGFGRFIKNNGDFYEGMCVNLKAHGKGSFFSPDGYVYNGEWENDKKHGVGQEVFPNGMDIKGTFENGYLHGNASIKFPDGSSYVGEIRNQKVSGKGEFTYANGEKYFGQLVNGKKDGNGIYLWPDGRRYDGQFSNDVNHGNGMFYWPDGVIYNGQWKNGYQHGFGIEKNEKEGVQREGEWENGKWMRWTKQQKI